MNSDFLAQLEYLEKERGIERETLLKAVQEALLSAAKKSVGPARDLRIEIDRKNFDIKALASVEVVGHVSAPHDQISLLAARKIKPDVKLGDMLDIEVTPGNFGRIAAQTAKQVILHRLRTAEKAKLFDEYKDRVGDIVSGVVRRFERGDVILDLGHAEAVMPSRERMPMEEYQLGDRIRTYLLEIQNQSAGPEIVLSRSHPNFVRKLFELEVSEIADGTVQIREIAREPGYRSKIAVVSKDDKIDPVGACVGLRGVRVKNIVRELSGEKIDIVRWSDDIRTFVTNALAPAHLLKLDVDETARTVSVEVEPDQLSLAIGKRGQNARLTAKLTGWKIDIHKLSDGVSFEEKVAQAIQQLAAVEGIGAECAARLVKGGFLSLEGIVAADLADLEAVEGLTPAEALRIKEAVAAVFENADGGEA